MSTGYGRIINKSNRSVLLLCSFCFTGLLYGAAVSWSLKTNTSNENCCDEFVAGPVCGTFCRHSGSWTRMQFLHWTRQNLHSFRSMTFLIITRKDFERLLLLYRSTFVSVFVFLFDFIVCITDDVKHWSLTSHLCCSWWPHLAVFGIQLIILGFGWYY